MSIIIDNAIDTATAAELSKITDQDRKDFNRCSMGIYGNSDDKWVDVFGTDQPMCQIIKHTDKVLVLKVKGHKYWRYRGTYGYAPAEYQVYDLSEATWNEERSEYKNVYLITDFPVRSD